MKNLLSVLIILTVFCNCKEDETYIWEDEDFAQKIEAGENDFIEKINYDDFFYGYTKISLKLNKLSHSYWSSQIEYVYVFDSVSALLNGEQVPIDFTFFGDSLAEVTPKPSFDESGNLKLNIHVSWYYADINEAKYTDGEPVYFGSEIESKEINIEYFDQFAKNDFVFTYPLHRQFNFLTEEYEKGYFRTKDLSLGSFFNSQNAIAKFTSIASNESFNVPITYNNDLNVMEYEIPSEFIEQASIYKISYHINDNSTPFYEYHFRTSYYKTFIDKWENEKVLRKKNGVWFDLQGVHVDTYNLNVFPVLEEMDSYESYVSTRGSSVYFPLIQFSSNTPNIMMDTKELMMYSIDDIEISRESKYRKYGYPPLDAIYFRCRDLMLTDEYIMGAEYVPTTGYNFQYFVCTLASMDINNMAVLNSVNDLYPDLNRMEDNIDIFYDIPKMDVFYVVPGINIKTTTIENYVIPN